MEIATTKITPGAGVDPRKIIKPGKRLRNWHRHGSGREMSLRAYARMVATLAKGSHEADTATRWLRSKGARP